MDNNEPESRPMRWLGGPIGESSLVSVIRDNGPGGYLYGNQCQDGTSNSIKNN